MESYKRIKHRTFEIIQQDHEHDLASRAFDIVVIILIVINVIVVMIDTFELPDSVRRITNTIENISVIIFTVEYLLRVWTADELYPDTASITKSRLRYIFSFMALIDLLAILPFYLPMVFTVDLRVLRMLRIIRLFRVFKINRYTTALGTISKVFKAKAGELISSMSVVLLLMLISSVLMYNFEHEAQPDSFTNIFQSMWWSVATVTTIGYGDIYPVTVAGKILSTIIALLGIGLVAVPTGIISAGFTEIVHAERSEKQDEKSFCPYCGKKLL